MGEVFTHSNDERNFVVFINTSNPARLYTRLRKRVSFSLSTARRHIKQMYPKSKSQSPEIQGARVGLPRPKTNKFKEVRLSLEVLKVFHEIEFTCSGYSLFCLLVLQVIIGVS